jgi:WD40 repeat protein
MGAGWFHQYLTLSPNQRWVTLDRGEDRANQIPRRFSVYDLENKTDYLLTDAPAADGVFLDWEEDSSLLYWIKQPDSPITSENNNADYGLLAFDTQTHRSQLLFKNALKAMVSPKTHQAFVLFPQASANNQSVLFGGILDLRSGTVIGSEQISERVQYYDPAWEFLADFDFAPSVWSHDGKRVVFGNSKGEIKILNVDGAIRALTTTFSAYSAPRQTFAWSPDDKHLLVNQGYRAWILDVSEQ